MILLDSLYINNSGGKVLLDYLIEQLHKTNLDVFFLIDERCKGSYPFLPEEKTIYLKASLKNRHQFYKENKNKFSNVLCFANIPPTIRLNAKVYTYFHNLLLAEQPKGYPLKARIKAYLKGLVIKKNKKNSDYFIVQSENVKKSLVNFLSIEDKDCLTIPFYKERNIIADFSMKKEDFIYISNGNPHKNHINLLKAWDILYHKWKIKVPLHLTITDEYPGLIALVENYHAKGLHIINHGRVDVKDLYSSYKYCVYPSLIESFGLGLIESVESNTEVIAANLPYVDAVIEPLGKFDPYSPDSIAETIYKVLQEKNQHFLSKRKTSNKIHDLIGLLH